MVSLRTARRRQRARIPWARWGIVGTAVALVLGGSMLVWRGCLRNKDPKTAQWGGMSKDEWLKQYKARHDAEDKQDAEAAKRQAEETKRKKEKVNWPAKLEAERRSPKKPEPEPPQLPPVPQEYTQWKDMDYFVARLTGNPRLVLAVEHRAKRAPGNEEEARFFRNLLAPHLLADLKQFVGGKRSAPSATQDAIAVIGAIAAALAENGTLAARQALTELLAGTISTENDQAAVQAALRALADHPSRQNDEILLAALTEPQEFRPPGPGRVNVEMLQREALRAIQQGGSSRVRLHAAQRFLDPACPPVLRKTLTPLVEQKHPENLEAHALLYQDDSADPKIKAVIERQLLECSQEALGRFFGIVGDRAGGGADSGSPATDPDWPYRVVRVVWSGGMAAALGDRQMALPSIDRGPNAILLAGTIATSESRSRLVRTLARHWEEGPTALRSAGWTTTILSEPGMLAVLKSARQSQPQPSRTDPKRKPPLGRSTVNRLNPQKRPEETRIDKDPWLETEEALLRQLCRRFLAAALAQARAQRAAGAPGDPENPDPTQTVVLHPRATVVATYQLQWPGAHREKLGGAASDPMDISYVRIEEKARPRTVIAHYERTVKSHQLHPLADGVWIEAVQRAADEGRMRSIDVLVTRASPKSDRLPDEPQELTIEILAVTIPALEARPGTNRRAGAEPRPDGPP